jgi:hypothetical protein
MDHDGVVRVDLQNDLAGGAERWGDVAARCRADYGVLILRPAISSFIGLSSRRRWE